VQRRGEDNGVESQSPPGSLLEVQSSDGDIAESFLERYYRYLPHLGLEMRPPLKPGNSKEGECRMFMENRLNA